ncbi:MAG: peptidoglycan DD-metalloendopeptidase family protein [Nitrospirae bacterium]|nr:peptidoglycan DD-metalloendopeptidase family protein [Nitrospirota bacterium]MBF0592486.1 peptidoglycan DD-metalloendopeptidase family protein [Nitrospirota bacterium]
MATSILLILIMALSLSFTPAYGQQIDQRLGQQVNENIRILKEQGRLPVYAGCDASLSLPVRAAGATLKDYGFYGIKNFVDHDPNYPGKLLDYYCGKRTYDLPSGMNHQGTDFAIYPFSWRKMDNNEVEVVAAAAGTIVYKEDGNFDRNCDMDNHRANSIGIHHCNGNITWYLHLKKDSLTHKGVGDIVTTGEYLGIVGSSGNSGGPHLHFEIRSATGKTIDPFYGKCNTDNTSLWKSQPSYYNPSVLKLMTGSAAPVFPTCPTPEITNEKDTFHPGETIYFTTFYRDQLINQTSRYTILKPDGSTFQSWTQDKSTYYDLSWWYWYFTLPANAPAGTWTFQVSFFNKTYQHTFTVL